MRRIAIENTGQALLQILRDLQVEYFFGNAGSGLGAIIDGFARVIPQGNGPQSNGYPKPILLNIRCGPI